MTDNQELVFIIDIFQHEHRMNGLVIDLPVGLPNKRVVGRYAIAIVIALIISPTLGVQAQLTSEYERYVHSYQDFILGNCTYMEKPVFPVALEDFQVPIGQNWSIVCPLLSDHNYHVYCYGKWIDPSSEPKTDYDIYVYNSLGEMESYHTEAAGLPEHLGTTVDETFFAPKYTGNYTFVVMNDARESKGAQAATFMIIEDVGCNVWYERYVEGKGESDVPVLNTSWAYDFVTESRHIEVYVKVPYALDMYEARLYLMSDAQSPNNTILNGIPLAWELGLFGNRSGTNKMVGGYNLESKEYRGVAYASCEFYGEDMFINLTSPIVGKSLYHLVLIGEAGSGIVDFLVKTEFNNAILVPQSVPTRVYPGDNATIVYASNSTSLKNATLEYSTDSWKTVNVTDMEVINRTCSAVIGEQVAGTSVNYLIKANDIMENSLRANGSYSVKFASDLNFSTVHIDARLGENITITGSLNPRVEGLPVTVHFLSLNESKEVVCHTLENGTFKVSFKPETVGTWLVNARFDGSDSYFASESPSMTIQVEEPFLAKYSFYIFGAMGAIIAIGMVVYVRKSRA